MSCNCNSSCKECGCKCGIYIDIFEGESLLYTYGVNSTCDDCTQTSTYTFFENSRLNIFHEDNREITLRYNSFFSRWEMAFFNEDLNAFIPFALYYTKKTSCPNSLDCWDDNVNVGYLIIDGVTVALLVWSGEIDSNGYKIYEYVASEYPGTWTESVTMSFDLADNRWKIYRDGVAIAEKTILGPSEPALDFTPIAPFIATTIIVDSFAGVPPLPGYTSPSGEKNTIKIREAECKCCDDMSDIIINVNGTEFTVTASAAMDEYGNIIGENGKAVYLFEFDSISYTIKWDGTKWVLLNGNDEVAVGHGDVDSECPIGFFDFTDCVYLRIQGSTLLPSSFDERVYYVGEQNGRKYWEWQVGSICYSLVYKIVTPGIDEYWAVVDCDTLEEKAKAAGTIGTDCPPINNDISSFTWTYTTEIPDEFNTFSVREGYKNLFFLRFDGVDCPNNCDGSSLRNKNLLKKKKAIFVKEVASIRNKELFGLKCGTNWNDLYKKHLILDVLNCLPYGSICEEEEQCLIDKLDKNCKC